MILHNLNILFLRLFVALVLLTILACSSTTRDSNSSATQYFRSPEEGLTALKAAFQSEDPEQLVQIYGKEGRDLIVSGDLATDRAFMRRIGGRLAQRAELVEMYSQEYDHEQWYKVRFGREGWLMRIPMVNREKGWIFATEYAVDSAKEGRREFNEVTTVDTLLALMRAQAEYYSADRDGDGVLEYASRIISSPSQRDGLYWPTQPGEPASPLDAVVARAIKDGYTEGEDDGVVYEGYVYRILTAQGPSARGGKMAYLENGNLTRGYAFLAYPVTWNVSGLKTFVVGPDGKIMKKDLGFRTDVIGAEMTEINPDRSWPWIEHPDLGGSNSRLNW